eukprot:jgi/Tetstr1/421944/TSEL_012843.t1
MIINVRLWEAGDDVRANFYVCGMQQLWLESRNGSEQLHNYQMEAGELPAGTSRSAGSAGGLRGRGQLAKAAEGGADAAADGVPPAVVDAHRAAKLTAVQDSPKLKAGEPLRVRPLGVGSVLVRLTSAHAVVHVGADAREAMGPVQRNFQSGAGCETAYMSMRVVALQLFGGRGTDLTLAGWGGPACDYMIDFAFVSSKTPTWGNDPRWCTPGIAATEAEHTKPAADRASSAPVHGVHRYYPFLVEDRGRLGKSALTVVYIFAVAAATCSLPLTLRAATPPAEPTSSSGAQG